MTTGVDDLNWGTSAVLLQFTSADRMVVSGQARPQGFASLGGQHGQERLRPGIRPAMGGLNLVGLPLAGVNGVLPGRSSGHLAHQLNIQQGSRPDEF